MSAKQDFVFEVMVDFVDDALLSPAQINANHIDAMMQRLKEMGIRRVSWGYYADGHGGMLFPSEYVDTYKGGWKACEAAYSGMGNPLKVAVEAGHRHGLEVYAYFKPYETGPSMVFPEGSPQAKTMGLLPYIGGRLCWMYPFVKAHPELRIKRRGDDLPSNIDTTVITALRLIKKNDSPTRITAEHIQIWISPDNWKYQQSKVKFQFSETVEKAPHDVTDNNDGMLTHAGQSVRVLTLSGLNLTDKYIIVTTDFVDGPADFVNAGTSMIEAMDDKGRIIPVEIATGATVSCGNLQNFRSGGLNFGYGWGDEPIALDASNADGRHGLIALTRGRNEYLSGALCESEPQVQKFWLSCLEEMISAGVDGVDFREENHSTHTDFPKDYGFNDVILKQCGKLKGQSLLGRISKIRGDSYTEFLRDCKRRLKSAGKRMRYNLQVDWFRPDRLQNRALAYPANMEWQWQRWVDEELIDEAILRSYSIRYHGEPLANLLNDLITKEMTSRCASRNIPVTFNRYLTATKPDQLPREVQQIRSDGRFSGFIFYETSNFINFSSDGKAPVSMYQIHQACEIYTLDLLER